MKWYGSKRPGLVVTMTVLCLPFWFNVSHANEWGAWDDLPDNLLESQDNVRTLEDLSRQLDQLIDEREGASVSSQQKLLERWLSQLAPRTRQSLSLDILLSLPDNWTDDQFEAWYESLEDASESSPVNDDFDDDDDDDFDDDDDDDDDE